MAHGEPWVGVLSKLALGIRQWPNATCLGSEHKVAPSPVHCRGRRKWEGLVQPPPSPPSSPPPSSSLVSTTPRRMPKWMLSVRPTAVVRRGAGRQA